MMTTKKIQLNTWGRNYVAVSAGQGEVNSRFLQITLVDETGTMTLTDKGVILYAVKPDGNVIYNSCTIENASQMIVSLELTSQMSSTPGVMACELHVTGASQEVLKIVGLEIVILKCPDTSQSVESTSEFTRLSEALGEVETLKDNYQAIVDSPLTYNYLGVCPVTYGGTGATSAGGARINLELVTEYGTWTPTISSSGTTQPTVTYTIQYGYYYAIGRLVYIACEVAFQCTAVGDNYPCIKGLPYSFSNIGMGMPLIFGKEVASTNTSLPTFKIVPNTSYITVTAPNGHDVNYWKTYSGTTQRISFSGGYYKY